MTAVDSVVKKLKNFSRNCLVDVTKSVLVLGKAIYDQSISDAIRFYPYGHRVGNRWIITEDLT